MKNSTKLCMKKEIEMVSAKPNKLNEVIKRKAPLKADVIVQLKELQFKFDAVENKHIENLEVIKILRERINHFENSTETAVKETQTETAFCLKCKECSFEASSKAKLSWHLSKYHGWSHDLSEGP